MNSAVATTHAIVRTWFHHVQSRTYRAQVGAPVGEAGSIAASVLLSGTLHNIVTPNIPSTYTTPATSIGADAGSPQPTAPTTTSTALERVVPKKSGMNSERRIVELMAFIAVTPLACPLRARAVMTNAENAK